MGPDASYGLEFGFNFTFLVSIVQAAGGVQ